METNSQNQIGIILMAAGSASRMRMPKQLLVYNREPLILHVLNKLLSLELPVTVVLGARAELISPVIADLPVKTVINKDWELGMGSSMQVGLKTHLDKKAVLLCVVDQPYLEVEVLKSVLACADEALGNPEKVIAAAQYEDGTLGVPALFGKHWFEQLLELPPSKGARKVLRANRSIVTKVDFPAGNFDLDEPEDWEKFRGNAG